MPKENPRFHAKLNGIQSCIDALWNAYGRFLLRFPWLILLSSALLSIGLSVYFLLFVDVRPFDQVDFFLPNGPAMQNAQRIQKIFGNDKDLRVHQQMDLYPALDVIIRRKPSSPDSNMLNIEVIDEVQRLNAQIQSLRIQKTRSYNYSRLCAVINRACVIDGNYLLSKKFRDEALRLPYLSTGIYIDSTDGANGISTFIFGKAYRTANVSAPEVDYVDEEEEEAGMKTSPPAPMTEIVSYVSVFRLRYALNVTTTAMSQLAVQWEREVLRSLNDNFNSTVIDFSASTSTAISDLVSQQAREEGTFLVILFSVFFLFVCSSISIEGTRHTSVGYLSLFGIISFVLSSGATFGLLTVLKISIIEPMALLVFVVASKCHRCSSRRHFSRSSCFSCGLYQMFDRLWCLSSNDRRTSPHVCWLRSRTCLPDDHSFDSFVFLVVDMDHPDCLFDSRADQSHSVYTNSLVDVRGLHGDEFAHSLDILLVVSGGESSTSSRPSTLSLVSTVVQRLPASLAERLRTKAIRLSAEDGQSLQEIPPGFPLFVLVDQSARLSLVDSVHRHATVRRSISSSKRHIASLVHEVSSRRLQHRSCDHVHHSRADRLREASDARRHPTIGLSMFLRTDNERLQTGLDRSREPQHASLQSRFVGHASDAVFRQ